MPALISQGIINLDSLLNVALSMPTFTRCYWIHIPRRKINKSYPVPATYKITNVLNGNLSNKYFIIHIKKYLKAVPIYLAGEIYNKSAQ